jgi:hypothetical protein
VTTYKPNFQFIKDFFEGDENVSEDIVPTADISKVDKPVETVTNSEEPTKDQISEVKELTTEKPTSIGDIDLGTGSPDPTIMDSMYYSTPTEPTSSENELSILDRAGSFSLMDYLFGASPTGSEKSEIKNITESSHKSVQIDVTTEQVKAKVTTTDSTYIPEEITAVPSDENIETATDYDIKKLENPIEEPTESLNAESTESSFMNPANVVSTSMSTEVSHETEICFRGKCIKTNKDIL